MTLSPAAFALAVSILFAFGALMLCLGYIIGAQCARWKQQEELLEVAKRAFRQGKVAACNELLRERRRSGAKGSVLVRNAVSSSKTAEWLLCSNQLLSTYLSSTP